MNALPTLPGAATGVPVPQPTGSTASAQDQAGGFAGVLDRVTERRDGATPDSMGGAKRKGTATGLAGTDEAAGGTGATSDGSPKSGDPAIPGQTTLDIAALAQSVALAAGIAPSLPKTTSAASTSSASSARPTASQAATSAAVGAAGALPGRAQASGIATAVQTSPGTAGLGVAAASSAAPLRASASDQSAPGKSDAGSGSSAGSAGGRAPDQGAVTSATNQPGGSAPETGGNKVAVASSGMTGARASTSSVAAAPAGTATSAVGATSTGGASSTKVASSVGVTSATGAQTADAVTATSAPTNDRNRDRESGRGSETPPADAGGAPTSQATAAPDPVNTLLATVGTPAQQVSGAIQSLVADTRATQSSAAAAPAATVSNSATGTVKTLTVELSPEHLGPVSITLRLQADTMDIRIAVSTPQALHQLEQDKHVLSAAVAALGGTAGSLHLGTNPDGAASGQPQHQPSFDRSGFSSDTASTGRQAQGQGRPTGTTQQSDSDDPTVAPASTSQASDGSLYL